MSLIGLGRPENMWIDDHSELVTFAGVLDDLGVFDAPKDAIDYFEKPWKWTPEHERWVSFGRPVAEALTDARREAILQDDTDDEPALADTERPSVSESNGQ